MYHSDRISGVKRSDLINVTVGVEDDLYVEGGKVYPYGPLNEYNSRKARPMG